MVNFQDLISVIVCTYNQQDTIGRTLDSILAQKCHLPIEVIIGEDNSTDNTLAVCRTYEERHPDKIRILANKPNKGFVRNYFDCIRACRGKYIADCSGDDFWIDDTKLEQESIILDENANIGIVHTDWLRYDERTGEMKSPSKTLPSLPLKGRSLRRKSPFKGDLEGLSLEGLILTPGERPAIHLCTSLYRNEWVRQAMQDYPQFFDPNAYQCEDIQISFFLARMGDVAYIDSPTLAYSCGGSTLSNPDSEAKQFHFWANVTRLSFDLASTFHITDKQLDTFFQARIHKLLMHAFRSGNSSLRTKVLLMQQEMNVADNRQIRIAKILTLPGIWAVMRHLRILAKSLPRL